MNDIVICQASGCRPASWPAKVRILCTGSPNEVIVNARGSSYHLIFGQQTNGNYLCIPDWNIGSELASLSDIYWNTERLRNYCHMSKADAVTIAQVLSYMDEIL